MTKIVIVGAGSEFGGRLSIDVLANERLREGEIWLCDVHPGRLEKVFAYVSRTVEKYGLIANLPDGCCVEVPCMADAHGVHPCRVGELPPQCAALDRVHVSVQELAVRAVQERNREAAFHAVSLCPITAAVLPLPRIREMFDRLWTKHVMFEDAVRVPLLIRVPGTTGGVCPDLVEHADLYPTLAALCGLPAPEGIDGWSFAPALHGDVYPRRDRVFSEYNFCHVFSPDSRYVGRPPIRMIRTDRWKLNHLDWAASELYDLEQDPNETENRVADPDCAEVKTQLESMLMQCTQRPR